jgi:hypothetical protein
MSFLDWSFCVFVRERERTWFAGQAGPVSAYLPEMAQSDRRNNLFTFVGATFRFIVCLSMYLGPCLRAAGPFELSVYQQATRNR